MLLKDHRDRNRNRARSTGRTKIFHVHHKPLYAAIGEPDNRNRRRVTIDRAIERLMVLDGVLADRSVTWRHTLIDRHCRHPSLSEKG